MTSNYVLIGFGIVVTLVAFYGKGYARGLHPRKTDLSPMTKAQRIAMYAIGIGSIILGVARALGD